MDGKNGLILWILGGTGILFLYSAYKAKSPQAVLLEHLNPGSTVSGNSKALPPTAGLDVKGSDYQLTPNVTGNKNLFDSSGSMLGIAPGPYSATNFIPTKGVEYYA
jgi:hypothetical protein